jgi:hypothetical protein
MSAAIKKAKGSARREGASRPTPSSDTDPAGPLPEVWAWVAEGWFTEEGDRSSPHTQGAVPLFAVSVHENYPATEKARLELMRKVGERLGSKAAGSDTSLWAFPGGYFGFNARAYRSGEGIGWPGFDRPYVRSELPAILKGYPAGTRLAFGADDAGGERQDQYAWICRARPDGAAEVHEVRRSRTDLPDRIVQVGPVCWPFGLDRRGFRERGRGIARRA